jgi:hypothetical protein
VIGAEQNNAGHSRRRRSPQRAQQQESDETLIDVPPSGTDPTFFG